MTATAGRSLSDIPAGTALGPIEVTVSPAANERYWAAAGVDHAVLRDGALYPPIAANLTIMVFQTVATWGVLQTGQHLVCHRRGEAGTPLSVSGTVRERFEKRGREYAIVDATVALPDGSPLWTSVATFCEP